MKKIVFALMISLMLFAVGCSSNEEPSPTTTATTQIKSEYLLNETATLDNIEITLLEVSPIAPTDNHTPVQGTSFIGCKFKLENKGDSEINIDPLINFSTTVDELPAVISLSAQNAADNQTALGGVLAPNQTMEGIIPYQVPTDYNQLNITVSMEIGDSDVRVFNYES